MGKTTLVRVVYRMVSNQFEACSFISNIRESSEKYGLHKLQQTLLNELLMQKDIKVEDVDNGALMIKTRLSHKKILLVLDDVHDLDQLKKLVGEHDWFGLGSRVIITTRDADLLKHKVDGIYEVEGLDYDEAFHLFNLKAFKKEHPNEDFLELSQAYVHYANGLPLAIDILGSFLLGRSKDEWKSELDRLKEFPERKILNILQISFDGLPKTEKEIFLYIACFFNHMDQDTIIEILDYLELYPIIGLSVLKEKSLIKRQDNQLWMHDLLQEMGRDIVHQESPNDPGERSRLWLYKDIDNVLTNNTGTKKIQGLVLQAYGSNSKWVDWNPESFSKMPCLKLLKIHSVHLMHDLKHLPKSLRILDWSEYPLKSLPSNFQSNELVKLCLNYSYIERLWKGKKGLSLDDRFDTMHFERKYDIIMPGSEIPKWFRHQNIGAKVNIKEPSHLCNEWMGIVVCAIFCSQHSQRKFGGPIHCWLTANGRDISFVHGYQHIDVLSDHILLLYLLPQFFTEDHIKLLWECDANGFSHIGVSFDPKFLEIKKCGMRIVYKKDIEDLNQTMAQSSNTIIIPYENHNFDNSAMEVEGNKAKRIRGDNDGAGPSGEGSSNDIPHPKKIKTVTEFMDLGNSDGEESSEYKECGEELSEWEESRESDQEG